MPLLFAGMPTFFTARQLRLMGQPSERAEVHVPTNAPARCCEAAVAERCTCEALKWRCPVHGLTGPCNRLSHD